MTTKFEKQKLAEGYDFVIGCDEVGRGSLAGPVVAAAVALPRQLVESGKLKVIKLDQVRDSKLLLPKKREQLSEIIKGASLAWGVGLGEPDIIDKINIHNATLLAMRRAVENLLRSFSSVIPEFLSASEKISGIHDDAARMFLYLDGKFIIPAFNMKQEAVVEGDNKIFSVAAASIIAKVYRDALMTDMDIQYPDYGFARHKGYGTLYHCRMIVVHGLSDIHRRSFCGQLLKNETK